MNKLKGASFFAGVGGIDKGFEPICNTIYANEYNEKAAITFEANFPIKVDVRDIRDVKAEEVPDVDIIMGGFPCQAFSVAGYRQGFKDEKGRGDLFFELARIIEVKKPKIVFLENVKNLVGHDNGKTFTVILNTLHELGYHVKYQVLNAMNYGNVPQNRERIYVVAFSSKKIHDKFTFPDPIELTKSIKDVIDYTLDEPSLFYTKEKFDFYDLLEKDIVKSDTVYQWRRKYVRENKSNVCPTLTANMGTGGHNVPLIKTPKGIRKLSPRECFLFQGFPIDFKLPKLANTHLYKQAGNSVVVRVIERIARQVEKALKEAESLS